MMRWRIGRRFKSEPVPVVAFIPGREMALFQDDLVGLVGLVGFVLEPVLVHLSAGIPRLLLISVSVLGHSPRQRDLNIKTGGTVEVEVVGSGFCSLTDVVAAEISSRRGWATSIREVEEFPFNLGGNVDGKFADAEDLLFPNTN